MKNIATGKYDSSLIVLTKTNQKISQNSAQTTRKTIINREEGSIVKLLMENKKNMATEK